MAGRKRLGFWYRVGWNVQYALLTLIGPAALDEHNDPRARMRAERAARERLAEDDRRGR